MRLWGLVAGFFRLRGPQRVMALEAVVWLSLARVLVRRVPMRYWRGCLNAAETDSGSADRRGLVRVVGRMVRAVSRRLPGEVVCLPRALAAHWMLRRREVSSRLVFGVRRVAPGRAPVYHAWVTVDGEPVVGGRNVETWTPLCAMSERPATTRSETPCDAGRGVGDRLTTDGDEDVGNGAVGPG